MSLNNSDWLVSGDNFNLEYFCYLVKTNALNLISDSEWYQIKNIFEKFKKYSPVPNNYYSSKSVGYLMQLVVNAYLTENRALWLLNYNGGLNIRRQINKAIYSQFAAEDNIKYISPNASFIFNSGNIANNHDIFNATWANQKNSWADIVCPSSREIAQIKTVEVKTGMTNTDLLTVGKSDFFSPHNADLVLYQSIFDTNTFVCYIKKFDDKPGYANSCLDYSKLLVDDGSAVLKLDCSNCDWNFNIKVIGGFNSDNNTWRPQVVEYTNY